MRIQKTKIYMFPELSDDAKEKAREWYRLGDLDYEWYDFIYEDAKTIGKLMGIEIDQIYFSGFSSQGDGACFEGRYRYVKGSIKAIASYAPQDAELLRIAKDLQSAQRNNFYRLSAHINHRGQYSHRYCAEIDVKTCDGCDTTVDAADIVSECLRDYMQWIYVRLESGYEWLNSDEQVDESIIMNEYEFTEDGRRA